MKKLSHAEISVNRAKPDSLHTVKRAPIYALIDSVRSSYNVGSIFRTSDGAMIEKLFLCGYTPHPPNKEILKTALGATESVPWEYVKDPAEVVKKLKSEGVKIAALEQTDSGRKYYEVENEDFPICLVVGNEITGVSHDLIRECDFALEIPQYGIKQSLNVAVAYGIAIFELRKNFNNDQ
ncbi:MAG: RNA methyltransferase [Ignavibacteriaceae bacterium]|nr:RNA methyltransferase [Ignavibacteriaceae bacterium]